MGATFCKGCGGALEPAQQYCPKCGQPTGGVAATPKPKSSFPVWIIVVAIVAALAIPVTGIVAAIFIPNFLTAMQKAKQKRTMADIRSLATAIEAYATDYNTYPPYGASLDDVEALVSPTYIREVPKADGWSRPIRYHCLDAQGDQCLEYAFQSAGKDGIFEDLSSEIEPEVTKRFECDILYANGAFVWYPDGTATGGY